MFFTLTVFFFNFDFDYIWKLGINSAFWLKIKSTLKLQTYFYAQMMLFSELILIIWIQQCVVKTIVTNRG